MHITCWAQHPFTMRLPFFSRTSVLLLTFLCAATAIACAWMLVMTDTEYNWTVCVGAYPFDPPLHPSLSNWELSQWQPLLHDWTIHIGSHPLGLVQTAHKGWPREGLPFLPHIMRLQTSRWHFDTERTASCAVVSLFSVSVLLAWLSYPLLRRYNHVPVNSRLAGEHFQGGGVHSDKSYKPKAF